MSSAATTELAKYASGRYRPTTFMQRGIMVPFTTPVLAGARIRPGERAQKELIISDHGNGHGYFVLPWSGLPDVCNPTLNDWELWQALQGAAVLTPNTLRRTVREVARDGLAGRKARGAALAAEARDRNAATVTNYNLLLRLIKQTESNTEAAIPPEKDSARNVEARAQRANSRATRALGCGPNDVASGLQDIADTLQEVGLGHGSDEFQIRDVMLGLTMLAKEAPPTAQSDEGHQAGRLLAEAALLNQQCARPLLDQIEIGLNDLTALLARWQKGKEDVVAEFERPAWLLDGWAHILKLWTTRTPESVDTLLIEMASLVPIIPREVSEWLGVEVMYDPSQRIRKFVAELEDWRTGRMLELVSRNENLLTELL